jgi:hypothetical protein
MPAVFGRHLISSTRPQVVPLSSGTAYRLEVNQWKVRLSASFIAFIIASTAIVAFGSRAVLQDPDTFWHIRTGQWILQNATVPTVDVFSHTVYGRNWIANDWLADVIFATAFEIGRWRAVVEVTAIAIGAVTAITCFYLTHILRLSVAIGLTAITALFISPHYLARPIIFAYPIMSIWLIILLERYDRDQSHGKPPLLLIPLMIFWANISGSFTIGLVSLYIFASYACYRHLVTHSFVQLGRELIFVLAVSASALITPYGIRSTLITLKALSMTFALRHITEWRSPDFQVYRAHLVYLIGIVSVFVAYGVRLRGPRLPMFILMMYLGLSYLRGLIMFVLLVPLISARSVAARAWYLRAQNSRTASEDPVFQCLNNHVVAISATSFAVAIIATAVNWSLAEARPPGSVAPQAAIDFVKQTKISGNVFNSYDFGGYLIFSGIPTAIDGRAQPFGDAFLRRFFRTINLDDVTDAFRMLDEYNIEWALLRPTEALSGALSTSSAWEKIYSDDHSVVFVRRRKLIESRSSTPISSS